jgi:hypothetical protein
MMKVREQKDYEAATCWCLKQKIDWEKDMFKMYT